MFFCSFPRNCNVLRKTNVSFCGQSFQTGSKRTLTASVFHACDAKLNIKTALDALEMPSLDSKAMNRYQISICANNYLR